MTSIINSSNSNSALINTINASDSKHNPNVYSTKKIYPAAATTYVTTTKSSGSVGANQTMVFDLMKYGIAQQMVLVYTKAGVGGNITLTNYDFVDVIDRVELLSSSKVIDTLTKYDLLAQFSNLDSSQFNIVNNSAVKARAAAATQQVVVPLVFGFFKDINTNLNLQFNEPMSVRVRWGANILQAGGVVAAIPETGVYLKLRYKAYNESDFSEILTENYNEPELNQMSTGFYDENATSVIVTQAAGAAQTSLSYPLTGPGVKVELKNTDCVNDFYIIAKQTSSYSAATDANHEPLKIKRIRFTASGQEIFDLEGYELFYAKLCVNGFSTLTSDQSNIENVCKIQTGLWEYAGGGTQSNTLSLRELNNPIIEVWLEDIIIPANGTGNAVTYSFDVVVVEDAVKIYSTTSATGRVMTSLSN
jgi:hypothetical protein